MAVLAVAVGAVVTVVGSASAATGTPVVGVASGRCLDVIGDSREPRAGVNIYDCRQKPNQLWNYTAARELRVYDDTMCLDVSSAGAVQIYPCNGGTNQKWNRNADGSIASDRSGQCLDVQGASNDNSALVQLWTCNGQGNQKWRSSDTTPPTPPANPRVRDLVCDAVTFAWDASTDDVAVAFYDIYHDGQQMKSVSGQTLSTSLTVVPGSSWGLYVNARDAAGNVSQASATVPIEVPQCAPDSEAPTTPRQLVATAAGTTVTLNWAASSDNIAVRAYDIYRDGAQAGTVPGTATSFIDSGLAPARRYVYDVVARDAQANESPHSDPATVTTGAGCDNPVCEVTQVATDTDIPWGLATQPDGRVLYTRRDAQNIVRLDPATGGKTNLGTVPGVQSTDGEGGLLGLAISPTFATDQWLYIMHTSPTDNRIIRMKLTGGVLDTGSRQVLISGILRNKFHNGGRLRFGPDGKLYASTGDAQNGDNAQNLANLSGKILRLNPDGTIPSDNPFNTYVWSYGHRNPQGLAFDAQGRLWEQEFGNSVMDETNLIVKGGNYGWPACEGTSGDCGRAGFLAPKRTYSTAEGSCSGITVVTNALYIACQRGTRMYRAEISGSNLTNVQTYFNGTYGRLRTVEPAPDGGLWLTTSNLGDKDSVPDNSNEKILHVTLGG